MRRTEQQSLTPIQAQDESDLFAAEFCKHQRVSGTYFRAHEHQLHQADIHSPLYLPLDYRSKSRRIARGVSFVITPASYSLICSLSAVARAIVAGIVMIRGKDAPIYVHREPLDFQ